MGRLLQRTVDALLHPTLDPHVPAAQERQPRNFFREIVSRAEEGDPRRGLAQLVVHLQPGERCLGPRRNGGTKKVVALRRHQRATAFLDLPNLRVAKRPAPFLPLSGIRRSIGGFCGIAQHRRIIRDADEAADLGETAFGIADEIFESDLETAIWGEARGKAGPTFLSLQPEFRAVVVISGPPETDRRCRNIAWIAHNVQEAAAGEQTVDDLRVGMKRQDERTVTPFCQSRRDVVDDGPCLVPVWSREVAHPEHPVGHQSVGVVSRREVVFVDEGIDEVAILADLHEGGVGVQHQAEHRGAGAHRAEDDQGGPARHSPAGGFAVTMAMVPNS